MSNSDFSFYNTSKYKIALCLSMSVFFYLFLVFFLPFGVDNYNPKHQYTLTFLLEIFYFFSVVLLFLLLNEFLLRPVFVKTAPATSIVLWSLWTFLLLGTVIFVTYNYLGNWHDFRLKSYLGFIVNCTSVLIFPLVGTFFAFRYRSLQRQFNHILTSKEASFDGNALITFEGQGSKDHISLAISKFLYGQAQDNYVELHYLEKEKPAKFLMRASIGKLIKSIDNPAIVRCHRSYIVNLYHVTAVKGGRSQISLSIGHSDTIIPVSNSYRDAVMDNLKASKNFD